MNIRNTLVTLALSSLALATPASAQRWTITSQSETAFTAVNNVTGAQAGGFYGPYGGARVGYTNPNTGAVAGAGYGPNGGFASGRVNPTTGVTAGTVVGPGGAGVHGASNANTGRRGGVAWIPGVGFAAAGGGPNAAGYVAYNPTTGNFTYGAIDKNSGQAAGARGNANNGTVVNWQNY